MANIADYIEKDKDLESEIQDAAEAQDQRDEDGFKIPDRFRKKTKADIAASYVELEKAYSQQGNDMGTLRQTVDQMLELQSQTQSTSPEQDSTADPVTVDDIYEDADGNIRRVARDEVSNEIDELKTEVQGLKRDKALASLNTKFPDWQTLAQSPEFMNWVRDSDYRARLAVQADQNFDFDAAEVLLGMYYDSNAPKQEQEIEPEVDNSQQLRDAMLESTSPPPTELVDTFSRYELMEKRIASKRGDLKAERWLAANAESIANAYAEGRIVD